MAIVVTGKVEAEFDGVDGGWTDIREDLIGGVSIRRGLRDDRPDVRVAAAGACTFTLNNSAANSLGLMGAYSWDHANRRSGFSTGIRVRVTLTRSGIVVSSSSVANPSVITTAAAHYLVTGETVTITGHTGSTPDINGSHEVTVLSPTTFSIPVNVTVSGSGGECSIDYPQFIGKISGIRTAPGSAGVRGTYVTAMDWLNQAAKETLASIELIDNARGNELVEAVLAVMSHQPVDTDFDEGLDVYAFAFDNIGKTAHAEFSRIMKSGYDLLFLLADETLRYENRDHRFVNNITPDVSVVFGAAIEMSPDVDIDRIVNRVIGTAHPRAVDDGFSVLYSLDDRPLLAPGETRTFRVQYTDPENPGERIGAVDVQEPEAGVDFIASKTSTQVTTLPNATATLRPLSEGHYTTFSVGGGAATKVAAVSDGSDSTYVGPGENGGLSCQSFLFSQITDAPANAPVASVKAVFRAYNNATNGGFVAYPRVRRAGVDLDLTTPGDYYDTGTFGAQTFERTLPRPGGGNWTVGEVNAIDVGLFFNWTSARPFWLEVSLIVVYTSEASIVVDDDVTADFSIVASLGGNAADLAVTNNSTSVGGYLTRLQLRGRRLTANAPVDLVSNDDPSIEEFGLSELSYDMPYQGDSTLVQGVIDYIRDFYKEPRTFLPSITVRDVGDDDALAVAVLRSDISTLVAVQEDVTGIASNYFINGIEKEIRDNVVVVARWLVTPADPTAWWVFDVVGRSEFDETTIFGPI